MLVEDQYVFVEKLVCLGERGVGFPLALVAGFLFDLASSAAGRASGQGVRPERRHRASGARRPPFVPLGKIAGLPDRPTNRAFIVT